MKRTDRIDPNNPPKIMTTTTMNLEGYKIVEYITIETAEYVTGTGVVSTFVSDFLDFFGVRSRTFESKLDVGRKKAFNILFCKAHHLKATAIIGVDIDLVQFEKNRTGIMITGTMVKAVPV